MHKPKINIEYLERPGQNLPTFQNHHLIAGLRQVGRKCFESLPDYQCFSGPDALKNKVLTVARNEQGAVIGFSSALLLDVEGVNLPVLHLGLTCVDPDYRGLRLTHKLASRVTVGYLLRNRPLGKVWLSNVACVLSSVSNVALNFDDVYPSPFVETPSKTHLQIARTIDRKYRDEIYIRQDAWLDEQCFVMRGSVKDTVFQKSANDTRYHHRNKRINDFYQDVIDFEDGDEVIQVGCYSLATFARYMMPSSRDKQPWFPVPARTPDGARSRSAA